ncbi:MAG: transglycosylase SLT domain-containing protein [Spirochaetes bacterium]|nr:transglycosylase SLT domain-containing protein [Spirochaetota bacterium]
MKKILLTFFIIIICSVSCAKSKNDFELSAELSERGFYYSSDQVIQEFEKNSKNAQKNFILARAYRDKKELKNALIYYSNSCFNDNYNFNLRLFPQPVYSFVKSSSGRSIFYYDSVYEIASIFFQYDEHEFVIKFVDLIKKNKTALYREAIILKSKSLQKLNRFKDAESELKDILPLFKDSGSLASVYLRLGSVYESDRDFNKAVDSYIDVIKSEGGAWQNTIAAKRIIYLIDEHKIQLDTNEKKSLFASSLYDAGEYDKALQYADEILKDEKSSIKETANRTETINMAETIKIKALTKKNSKEIFAFLKTTEKNSNYDQLLLEHANILWENGKKYDSIKVLDKLLSTSDDNILERVLTRLSFFYEERNKPEFIKYMELYIKKFPSDAKSGRFIWLIGRYYVRNSDSKKAIEYFNKGIKEYPDNIYTSYSRFWLQKINPNNKKTNDEFLEEMSNHPDSYHALTLMKAKADKTETLTLSKEFEKAIKDKNGNSAKIFHNLLFIKNGYDSSYSDRIKELSSDTISQYNQIADLMKNPVLISSYKQLLLNAETYFYSGDIDSLNRELRLIPDNDTEAQKDMALAIMLHSIKHKYFCYSTYYGFKLLNILKIKENLSLLPKTFSEALYPYGFEECVNSESKSYNIKSEIVLSMIKIESNFNFNAVSPVGASGLMQLMPQTAKGIAKNLKISKYNLYDPCTSIKFGVDYISWLNKYYKGQIEYMVAAYNGGAGNVDKWKTRELNSKDMDYFSEFTPFNETRDYIFRTKKYIIQYESIYKKR